MNLNQHLSVFKSGVTCDRPDSIIHGSFSPSVSSHKAGALVIYTCKSGYELVGDSTRSCEMNGKWNGTEPSCKSMYGDSFYAFEKKSC